MPDEKSAPLTPIQNVVGMAILFGDDTLTMTGAQAVALTERIERALLALPVEERMEAMGMRRGMCGVEVWMERTDG